MSLDSAAPGDTALALVSDLFFRSKLDAAAAALGANIAYASNLEAAARRAAELSPALVFVDLSEPSFPAAETASSLRAAGCAARLVGFASHVDLKALRAARDAGFEMVLSRSEFTARLPELFHSPAPR
jgi:DNA-binding NarL/FixJ family response regulator